jgi:gluconate 2-dehydrogenase gamma chain
MTDVNRRDVLKFLAAAPLAQFAVTALDVEHAATRTRDTLEALAARGARYQPKYFTPQDWRTVHVLADLVIPRDARSGSATDAGVPVFMDFILGDRPNMRPWIREGLAWLDVECEKRYGHPFRECPRADQTAILDEIAWPAKAEPEMRRGVRFFSRFRDFTASGFWSSKMGVQDLQYIGNTVNPVWNGCPPAVLRKLGVRYGRA